MYSKTFSFSKNVKEYDYLVSSDTLFSNERGYGFFTEELQNVMEQFTYPEINNGFMPYYWYNKHQLTHITTYNNGVTLNNEKEDEGMIPLSFKVKVPRQGNYQITICIDNNDSDCDINNLLVFLSRRRLVDIKNVVKVNEVYTITAITNVCDIIPRNQTKAFFDDTLDITVVAIHPKLTYIKIEEINCPTIYVAGDSTVTDQCTSYPYLPEHSYCGWAQMLGYYIREGVSISNHSHSGLTTNSFRSEKHYEIIQKNIKKGDYVLFQFGHNDQKLPELSAYTGYINNLYQYIDEIRSYGAYPIIVTPIGRNTWKGIDNSYNDLLSEHANACIKASKEKQVPLIDLHKLSIDFIKENGLENTKRYFFYNDYTHTNDYGAYYMAGIVAKELKNANLPFSKFINTNAYNFIPPKIIDKVIPPVGYENIVQEDISTFTPNFEDISGLKEEELIIKLCKIGIIPNDTLFRPNDIITRVEALSMVIKCVNFVPVNVYNDMYQDVIGHEWYAGTVESAYTNGIVDERLIHDNKFLPLSDTTGEMLISYIINSLRSRKSLDIVKELDINYNCSDWAKEYLYTAYTLGIIDDKFKALDKISRKDSIIYIAKLRELI